MNIRPGEMKDGQSIATLLLALHDLHCQSQPDRYRTINQNVALEFVAKRFDDPDSFYFVAEESGQIAGYIFVKLHMLAATNFTPERKFAFVCEILVKEPYRKAGFGLALLRAARLRSKELGCAKLELQVGGFNESAFNFFRSAGFKVVSRTMAIEP